MKLIALITDAARADIDQIADYIASQSTPVTALRVANSLFGEIERLATFPQLGHARADGGRPDQLFRRVYSYLIAFHVAGEFLIVDRVVHGSRDFRKIF